MPHDYEDKKPKDIQTLHGTVGDIFAHRFVMETNGGKRLADLGKHNAHVTLKSGDKVEARGEAKPSELKIHELSLNGKPVALEHKDKHDKSAVNDARIDQSVIDQTVRNQNVESLAQRRKPQHVEVLGRTSEGELVELHIELDGNLRKTKAPDADKWPEAPKAA